MRCTTHPDAAAEFRCDGCARLLCAACVEEGHRLLFCVHCRERALPLTAEAAATAPERRRDELLNHPYSLLDALRYPFRGAGRYMLPAYVATLTVAGIVPGCGLVVAALVALLLPGLVFEIVRTTAAGDDVLPDWPDYTDPFPRFKEWLWLTSIAVVGALPTIFLFRVTGCDATQLLLGGGRGLCWLALLAGLALGLLFAVFALGATGCYSSGWLAWRLDLHLQALLSPVGASALATAGLVALLLVASQLAAIALRGLPLVGALVEQAISGYALFLGPHLVGLLFRREAARLDPLYTR